MPVAGQFLPNSFHAVFGNFVPGCFDVYGLHDMIVFPKFSDRLFILAICFFNKLFESMTKVVGFHVRNCALIHRLKQ